MSWRTIGLWSTIYITLSLPLAMLLGKLLHRAALRTIPAQWVDPEQRLPCLSCPDQVEIHWQEDGIWLCCPSCGRRWSAERYQLSLAQRTEPAG